MTRPNRTFPVLPPRAQHSGSPATGNATAKTYRCRTGGYAQRVVMALAEEEGRLWHEDRMLVVISRLAPVISGVQYLAGMGKPALE